MKDDNLGLGAKSGVNVPATGLDAFQCLLGRLNGKKDDDLEKEQKTRDDLRRAVYTENRWGALRFVSGGFLVGDRIKGDSGDEPAANVVEVISMKPPERLDALLSETEPRTAGGKPVREDNLVKKQSKKRKHATTEELRSEAPQGSACGDTFILGDGNADEVLRREMEEHSDNRIERTRQAEKAQRKLARHVRRKEKRLRLATEAVEEEPLQEMLLEAEDAGEHVNSVKPLEIKGLTGKPPSGMHNVRSRYVQQKKMALMDPKALNEVHNSLQRIF